MKNKLTYRSIRIFSFVLCLIVLPCTVLAQTSTFSYQGRLTDSASAANGIYEMQFALYDAVSNGNQVGSTITNTNVSVTNGIFSVELDFGASSFPGADRWLEIQVKKPSEGSYTTLTPRQKLNSVPYAVRAANVLETSGNNVITAINNAATNITIDSNRLPSDIVRIKPAATQPSTTATDGTDAMMNLTGNYDQNGARQSDFRVNHDGGFLIKGEHDGGVYSGGIPLEGAGTRMMWHPRKAAFRAGYINGTQWDDANIGYFSVAMGEDVRASGDNGVAFGYKSTAAQLQSFAAGAYTTASGAASVALGYYAHTNARQGSFVFADRSVLDDGDIFTDESFRAGVNHSASWRVSGGFRIFTSSNLSTGVTIQSGASVSNWGQSNAVISTSTGAMLTTGGVWQNASSRYLKTNFAPVNSRSILQKVLSLPIQTWNYKSEADSIRHIGAFSQDFYKAFNVGNNDEGIGTVDADGVALAAIQGLNEELKDRDKKIEEQQQQLTALQQQVKQQQQQMQQQQTVTEGLRKLFCQQHPNADVCK